MDKLAICVHTFEKLLDIQYHIIIGRKGKTTKLCISFSKLDFHHLMGLGKLKDLRIATRNRGIVFDDNRLVFRYNMKANQFSVIDADYLLSTPYAKNDIYIFLAKQKETGRYFCRSFFPKEQKDYTKGQAIYTMLYKEKIFLSTGLNQIQYNRLTTKKTEK